MSNSDSKEKILENISTRLGANPDDLRAAAKSGDFSEAFKNLKPEDAQKLQTVLSDKESAAKILATPQAQKILKYLLGEK